MASNSIGQFLSLKQALDELKRAGEDVFELHQRSVISTPQYDTLAIQFESFDKYLRSVIEPEYMQ